MAERFSEEQVAEIKEVFTLFDKDGSGSLDIGELETIMRPLVSSLTQGQLNTQIKFLDANRNGLIDFSEFLTMLASIPLKSSEEHVSLMWTMLMAIATKDSDIAKEALSRYHKDGKGSITNEELTTLLTTTKESITKSPSKIQLADAITLVECDDCDDWDMPEIIKLFRKSKREKAKNVNADGTVTWVPQSWKDKLLQMLTPEEVNNPEKQDKAAQLFDWIDRMKDDQNKHFIHMATEDIVTENTLQIPEEETPKMRRWKKRETEEQWMVRNLTEAQVMKEMERLCVPASPWESYTKVRLPGNPPCRDEPLGGGLSVWFLLPCSRTVRTRLL